MKTKTAVFRAGTKARKVFELLANTNGAILRADIKRFYDFLEPRTDPRYSSLTVGKILSKIGKRSVIDKRIFYTLDINKCDKRNIWEKLESKLNEINFS